MTEVKTLLGTGFVPFHIRDPVKLPVSPGDTPPVYITPDFSGYDFLYRKVVGKFSQIKDGEKYGTELFTHQQYPLYYNPLKKDYPEFPDPYKFDSYQKYVQALEAWEASMRYTFSSACMPTPLISSHYCPVPGKILQKSDKAAQLRTFKPNIWPLLPENYQDLMEIVLDPKPQKIDPEKEFNVQIPKREKILMKHHVTASPQWETTLIPPEPNPEFYENFDDYQTAYKRWATLTDSFMKKPIPQPTEMGNIISIEKVNARRTKRLLVQTKEQAVKLQIDDRLLKQQSKLDEELISRTLKEIGYKEYEENLHAGIELEETFNYIIPGFDPYTFINEMTTKGINTQAENSDTPAKPWHYSVVENETQSEEIYQIFEDFEEIDIDIIKQILDFRTIPIKMIEYMNHPINGKPLHAYLGPFLGLRQNMEQILEYRTRSKSHRLQLSIFLNALLISSRSSALFSFYESTNDVELLYDVAEALQLASNTRHRLLSRLRDDQYRSINALYVFSFLLDSFAEFHTTDLFDFLRGQCAQLSRVACSAVRTSAFQERLSEGATRGLFDEAARAALMCLHTSSAECHKAVIRVDCLFRFNEFASTRRGANFVADIMHSDAMLPLAHIFVEGGAAILTAVSPTPILCYMIAAVMNFIARSPRAKYIMYYGSPLIDAMENVVNAHTFPALSMLNPFFSLISAVDRILDFESNRFRAKQIKLAAQMCEQIDGVDQNAFRQQARAVSMLGADERMTMILTNLDQFVFAIVKHLTSADCMVRDAAWEAFDVVFSIPSGITALKGNEKCSAQFAAVARSRNPVAIRRMLLFAMKMWARPDVSPEQRRQLCEVLEPALGTIGCADMNPGMYLNDRRTGKTIQKFVEFVLTSQFEEMRKFKMGLQKHINSVEGKQ